MSLKIAYDIRVFAKEFERNEHKTGVYRETEEIMRELGKRDDVDLTLVCLGGKTRFIYEAFRASLCVKNDPELSKYKFLDSSRSRLNIKGFHYKVELIRSRREPQNSADKLLKSIFAHAAAKILKEFDADISFTDREFDVYHSTYHKLPDVAITKNLPRVLTVQDMIPAVSPELVAPSLVSEFNETLGSINHHKDWVICISEYTQKQFCEFTGMSIERTSVTPLAAASHFYPVTDSARIDQVRQKYSIPQGRYFLSIASHLAPHKNLAHLIRCFFQLLSTHPNLDIKLVLAGSKRNRSDQSLGDSTFHQFSDRVIYTGYVADEDLSALYSGATAFIFPSLYEGFGLPPLEAMSCGTPVICSNTTSLPEVVGNAGILIDPRDENALCQAMLDLLKDDLLVQELRQKGIERSRLFSWSKCTADTVDVYKKVLCS